MLRVEFHWPAPAPSLASDNFFLGIWHPHASITVRWRGTPPLPVATLTGRNWAMAGAVSGLHDGGGSLLHETADGTRALAFRGYLAEPPLHSYSGSQALLRYWGDGTRLRHNGVFCAALIEEAGQRLTLATDVMGFAPMYYAVAGEAVLFATSPRLLALDGSEPDMTAWRCLLESGFIGSDRSLTRGVSRLPAGKRLLAGRQGMRLDTGMSLEALARGDRRLDAEGIAEVEASLHQAMDRCLALEGLEVMLPLSSGHDSRRILGSLLRSGRPFETLTCRVFHKGRDLDARFAAEMARDLGLSHRIVEPPADAGYAEDDRTRQVLTDAESGMHSWVPQFMRALGPRPAMVLDGVVGDILGNPGFRIPGLYQSRARDIDIILDASLPGAFDRLLAPPAWPDAGAVREDLRGYLLALPQRINLAEFAFILLRQRRTTGPWSQALLPPGHVAVCPFLDLDYLELLLSFVPADKHAVILQRRCLAEFWPQLYRYPGTRDIPADAGPATTTLDRRLVVACGERRLGELRRLGGMGRLRGLLTARGQVALAASRLSHGMLARTDWQLATLEELMLRELTRDAGWRLGVAAGVA